MIFPKILIRLLLHVLNIINNSNLEKNKNLSHSYIIQTLKANDCKYLKRKVL